MKKTNKVISIILAILMTFTTMAMTMTAYAADGEDAAPVRGKIVVKGTGETTPILFSRLLKYNKFTAYYESWCDKQGVNKDSRYVLLNDIDKYGYITGKTLSYDEVMLALADELEGVAENDRNAHIYNNYFPVYICDIVEATPNFWENYGKSIPTSVVIESGVTRISFGAFAFCDQIETVVLGDTVKNIDSGAFAHTGISSVVIPESVEFIGTSAFNGCDKLMNVEVNCDTYRIGQEAFNNLPAGSVINCRYEDAFYALAISDPDVEIDGEMANLTADHSYTTRVMCTVSAASLEEVEEDELAENE